MSTDKNLPCPFCGGACDPEGWSGGGGTNGLPLVRGPECEQCGATADTIEDWNRRASPAAAVPEGALPPLPEGVYMPGVGAHRFYNAEQMQAYARAAVEADRARQTALPTPFCKVGTGPHGLWAERGADGGEPVYTASQVQAILADRAQQGEPVACRTCGGSGRITDPHDIEQGSIACPKCAATKAAAPADASSQQQEMVVRVAPAPAGQHDADELVALGAKMAAWLFGLSKSGLPYESWAEKCAEYSAAWDSVVATSRAQRTTIDNNSAAPVSSTATAGAVTEIALNVMKRERAVTKAGFALTADLLKIDGPTVKGVDYVPRDALCSRIVAWRMEMDKAHKVSSQDVRTIYSAAPQPPEAKAGEDA